MKTEDVRGLNESAERAGNPPAQETRALTVFLQLLIFLQYTTLIYEPLLLGGYANRRGDVIFEVLHSYLQEEERRHYHAAYTGIAKRPTGTPSDPKNGAAPVLGREEPTLTGL